ncbi:muconolactone Delta-isomerase family protein [Actinomycetospora sp. CA-053990]|uniref:muconolactone Delta-isomerase family protein n=1 Tax=Actinomycetospora sp. CA-053990 TaxID=3239891 RepID=UPI003D91DF84
MPEGDRAGAPLAEYLVEFEIDIPPGAARADVERRTAAEAAATADLVSGGHLVRLWTRTAGTTTRRTLGLYRAHDRIELDTLLAALPLYEWMHVEVTPLEGHPHDPAPPGDERPGPRRRRGDLPEPRLVPVFRLDADLAAPRDVGPLPAGRRRIVALTTGRFSGPAATGTLVPGSSADRQTVLDDGTALGDISYTLATDDGALLDVRSHSIRHGSPAVLARLADGKAVDPDEYVFRAATRIETGSEDLAWMNKGVFVTVGGRRAGGVTYETYLVE